MRTHLLALALASSLLACHSVVIEGLAGSSTGSPASTTGGGAGSTTTTGATTTTTATTGAGGAPAAPPACTFSVTGAVDLADSSPHPVSNFILGPNMFQCGSNENGGSDRIVVYLGADVELGLGSFSAPYGGSYLWEHCDAQGCSSYANDGSPYQAAGCAVSLTLAPAGDAPGQPIAGTFSCADLPQGGISTKSVSLTGSFSLLTEAVGSPATTTGAGGSTASSTGGAGGSSSSTGGGSGAGGGGSATEFCTLSVSGAIDIAPDASSGSPYSDAGSVVCYSSVLGAEGWFSLDLGKVHGPGTYPMVSGGYQLSFCAPTGQGCTEQESFGVPSGAAGCSAEITVAPPVIPTYGQPLAGSFSCPSLVDETDAGKSVAVSGSFALIMEPPPE
jgi:hypothetical protein